ncbi:hypothetical protein BCR44DRAFT_1427810, partial [Catenaria anguillulae PL171]
HPMPLIQLLSLFTMSPLKYSRNHGWTWRLFEIRILRTSAFSCLSFAVAPFTHKAELPWRYKRCCMAARPEARHNYAIRSPQSLPMATCLILSPTTCTQNASSSRSSAPCSSLLIPRLF